MKAKTIFAIIFVVALLVGASLLIYYLIPQTAFLGIGEVPTGCNIASSGSTDNVFNCESEECYVNGFRTCTTTTGGGVEQRVIFRTNADDANDLLTSSYGEYEWIALDANKDGYLEGYDNQGGCSGSLKKDVLVLVYQGINIWKYTLRDDVLWLENGRRFCASNDGRIDLSTIPKEPYTSNEQELYLEGLGEISHYCETPWEITNNEVIIGSGVAIYSASSSGDYDTGVKELTSGDIFTFSGSINYAIVDASQFCSVSKCNEFNTGYYACETDFQGCSSISNSLTLCPSGELCVQESRGAVCSLPFTLDTQFQDLFGNEKTGYGLNEDIFFRLLINSNSVDSAVVEIKLLDSQENLIMTRTRTLSFPNSEAITVDFPGQSQTGRYIMRVVINFEDKKVTRDYEFRVANPITLSIRAFSEGAGTTLYTNEPSIVELRVFDDAGNPTSANTNIIADINGITLTTPNRITQTLGVYQYILNVQEEGALNIVGTAEKLGFSVTNTEEFLVTPATIDLNFKDIGILQDLAPASYTIKFETRDPQGSLINTQNTAEVLLPSGRTEDVSFIRGANGKYEFSWNFQEEGGYKFTVRSSASGYTPQEESTPFINVIAEGGTPQECDSRDDCDFGENCVNGECVEEEEGNTILVWVIVIVGVIGVIVIILLIVMLRRRRR